MKPQEKTKRVTVYFDPVILRAIKLKSFETERPLSELVCEAVRLSLAEDAEDLLAFEKRAREPDLDFEKVVKEMKKDGLL
ncbi:MAG: CopG family transcriptional regulator [Deltaproteobacteria bacterium]|nr:CopG family transcriptional regulator [Deltaproteobacteria bacterium]